VWLLVSALWGSGHVYAEAAAENRLDKSFFVRFGSDFKDVLVSPLHWQGRDFWRLAAVSGTGLLIYALDQDIQDWVQEKRTQSSDDVFRIFSLGGNGAVLLGLSGVLYAAGEIGHDDGLRRTALLSVESLATASVIVWTAKAITGRSRPYTGDSSRSFHPFSFSSSRWSLPSGHAAAAFSVATAIAKQSKSPAIDVLAYGLAAMASLDRIHDNKHWASDVFIGSAVGFLVGKKIAHLNRRAEEKKVSLGIQMNGRRQALTLVIMF
jgi:membrane-associated phospholipid phosphatase